MQDQSPFSSRPPLPTPDGNVFPPDSTLQTQSREWKDAPPVVKGWAYALTWLNMIATPFFIFMAIADEKSDTIEKGITIVFLVLLLGFVVWLNRALKNGLRGGWTGQMILSVLGLLAFPLGTAINIYILSQWFKSETKVWFGKS